MIERTFVPSVLVDLVADQPPYNGLVFSDLTHPFTSAPPRAVAVAKADNPR